MNAIISNPTPGLSALARTGLLVAACLLISACSLVGNNTRDRATVYDLDPRVEADAAWPAVKWQLSLPQINASRVGDSLRIAVRPVPHELQIYKGASWARIPTDMIEGAILRTMEDSGRIPAVARQGSGIAAEYKLLLELRRFESAYSAPGVPPTIQIEINAKLLHVASQRVAASRTFNQEAAASSAEIERVVEAFERALHAVTGEVVGWVLVSGNEDVARRRN